MRPARLACIALAALALLGAGCISVDVPDAAPQAAGTKGPGPTGHAVTCRPVFEDGSPVAAATCRFRFPSLRADGAVDGAGVLVRNVPHGERGTVAASAPGSTTVQAELTVQAPVAVRLVLARPTTAGPTTTTTAGDLPVQPLPEQPAEANVSVGLRAWRPAVTVLEGSGAEPHVVVDADGRVFYAPTGDLYRSTDGGKTFQVITPSPALPSLGGDTAVQVAPDGSVWWARYWGFAGATIGCTSTDHGDSWTCDNSAVPTPTDRMWIAGKDGTTGYVMANAGLYQHVWAQTTTGSTKYTPTATTTSLLNVRNGNMVYDEVHDAFWQIEFAGGTQQLYRIDGATGIVSPSDTGVPNTYALPWLSVHEGVLWTTGEPDGGAAVLAARSTDGGATWQKFDIKSQAASVSFSYIAAGPDGRVVLVYYGSDKPGPSTENGGHWSLYVAETDNGLAAEPVWIETKLVADVHDGNLCIGLNCETMGDDPEARFAGDLIGAWVDAHGDAHLAYMQDDDGTFLARYLRQG